MGKPVSRHWFESSKCSDDFPPESTSNFIIPKHVFLCHAHKKPVQAAIIGNKKIHVVLLGIQMLLAVWYLALRNVGSRHRIV